MIFILSKKTFFFLHNLKILDILLRIGKLVMNRASSNLAQDLIRHIKPNL